MYLLYVGMDWMVNLPSQYNMAKLHHTIHSWGWQTPSYSPKIIENILSITDKLTDCQSYNCNRLAPVCLNNPTLHSCFLRLPLSVKAAHSQKDGFQHHPQFPLYGSLYISTRSNTCFKCSIL